MSPCGLFRFRPLAKSLSKSCNPQLRPDSDLIRQLGHEEVMLHVHSVGQSPTVSTSKLKVGAGRIGHQFMAAACTRSSGTGKVYLSAEECPGHLTDLDSVEARIKSLCERAKITLPSEPIVDDSKNSFWIRLYGFSTYKDVFSPRQLLSLLSFLAMIKRADQQLQRIELNHRIAILAMLAAMLDRLADFPPPHVFGTVWVGGKAQPTPSDDSSSDDLGFF